MYMIQIAPQEGTKHHPIQSQSHREAPWIPGYIEIPEGLVSKAEASLGWCDLVIAEGVLVDIIPLLFPQEEAPPSPQEDMETMMVDHEYRLTLLELGVM